MDTQTTPPGEQRLAAVQKIISRDRKTFERKQRMVSGVPERTRCFVRDATAAEQLASGGTFERVMVFSLDDCLFATIGDHMPIGWSDVPSKLAIFMVANLGAVWTDTRSTEDVKNGVYQMAAADVVEQGEDARAAFANDPNPFWAVTQMMVDDLRQGAGK